MTRTPWRPGPPWHQRQRHRRPTHSQTQIHSSSASRPPTDFIELSTLSRGRRRGHRPRRRHRGYPVVIGRVRLARHGAAQGDGAERLDDRPHRGAGGLGGVMREGAEQALEVCGLGSHRLLQRSAEFSSLVRLPRWRLRLHLDGHCRRRRRRSLLGRRPQSRRPLAATVRGWPAARSPGVGCRHGAVGTAPRCAPAAPALRTRSLGRPSRSRRPSPSRAAAGSRTAHRVLLVPRTRGRTRGRSRCGPAALLHVRRGKPEH